MVEAFGFVAKVHLALEDAHGDSAIIEHIAGNRDVHHGREYTVMTNEPAYSEQLRLLDLQVQQLQEQGIYKPSSTYPLPGNVSAVDHFQRVTYFSRLLPQPNSDREAIANILSVTRNASVPYGAPFRRTVQALQHRIPHRLRPHRQTVLLRTDYQPELMWTELDQFKLSPGSPVMTLNPDDISLTGDVSEKYTQAPDPFDPS